MSDNLYDSWPKHWAGGINALLGMISVDGKCYRFMGPDGVCPTTAQQTNLQVTATQTTYTFMAGVIRLTLTFTTPALLDDLTYLQIPATFVTFQVENTDKVSHTVQVYYDNSAEATVCMSSEIVQWKKQTVGDMAVMSIGTYNQIFNEDFYNDRIDWGFWYVSVKQGQNVQATVASDSQCRGSFVNNQDLPPLDQN